VLEEALLAFASALDLNVAPRPAAPGRKPAQGRS
jgi:hypothetical protein